MELVNKNGHTATLQFKIQLNRLIQDVFGFSFQRFHELNVWDEDYEYFSIVDEDTMIANIGVYHMQMVLGGREQTLLQIGAVATAPSHRRQGLIRRLFEEILGRYPDAPMYLYGGDDVVDLYRKFGFQPVPEQQPLLTVTEAVPFLVNSEGGCVPLALLDAKVDQYLRRRKVFAQSLDCLNPYAVNWFHLAYNYSDCIYELPADRGMVVLQTEGAVLRVLDLVLPQPLALDELLGALPLAGKTKVEFGFTPDYLCEDFQVQPFVEEDSNFMVKGWSPADVGGFLPRLTRT